MYTDYVCDEIPSNGSLYGKYRIKNISLSFFFFFLLTIICDDEFCFIFKMTYHITRQRQKIKDIVAAHSESVYKYKLLIPLAHFFNKKHDAQIFHTCTFYTDLLDFSKFKKFLYKRYIFIVANNSALSLQTLSNV